MLYLVFFYRTGCINHIGIIPASKVLGPTWGPSGADRTQVGPMLAPWTLLSGILQHTNVQWNNWAHFRYPFQFLYIPKGITFWTFKISYINLVTSLIPLTVYSIHCLHKLSLHHESRRPIWSCTTGFYIFQISISTNFRYWHSLYVLVACKSGKITTCTEHKYLHKNIIRHTARTIGSCMT